MSKTPVIAIAGNPNAGKSTVFNRLTGSRQSVGNWPGVTVDKKSGEFSYQDVICEVVDLPGIYALNAWSEDERIARDFLLSGEASLVINVVDSSNVERNLYLTRQLQEMQVPMLVVLNMHDLAIKNGVLFDAQKLSRELGEPVVVISAVHPQDKELLAQAIVDRLHDLQSGNTLPSPWPKELQDQVEMLAESLAPLAGKKHWNNQWIALKLLEGDPQLEGICREQGLFPQESIIAIRKQFETQQKIGIDEWFAELRYQQIEGILAKCDFRVRRTDTFSDKLDRIVMHKVWGFPIFLIMMYFVFWMTINFGGAFIDFFDMAFGALFVDGLSHILGLMNAPEVVISILAHGVGAGIQTLSTFFPIIFVLFFVIALLESSGYMARAAFVMDRLMRVIGLPGKAFIPLLVGFGCTVPAVMSTRSLENKRDRILTVFMAPFMSCGARLPVYVLFAAAFFPGQGQNLVFALYLVGIVLAVFTGLLLKGTVYKGTLAPFILELPSYHKPQLSAVLKSALWRLRSFVKKGGRVLIPIIAVLGVLNSIGTDGSFGNQDSRNSVLSSMGKAITPVFEPMGVHEDNWPASVGLFTGLFAKEVIVGSLNSLYSQEVKGDNAKPSSTGAEAAPSYSLGSSLLSAVKTIPTNLKALGGTLLDPLGIRVGEVQANQESAEGLAVDESLFATMRAFFHNSTASAISYLLFILLYIPCVVAVSAIWKEVGRDLTLLQMLFSTVLGWSLATITFQVLEGGSLGWIASSIGILLTTILFIVWYARRSGRFEG